jgi:patatin-like phospholipase/acyl hydrolase
LATFRILSIDGGGIRGVFPAHVLQCVEERLGVNLYDTFDMIAGTSTGSIIAAAVATKVPTKDIVAMYRERAEDIFPLLHSHSLLATWVRTLYIPKHSVDDLRAVLSGVFKDTLLGDISKPLLLPSSNVGSGDVHVLKSRYSSEFTRDMSVPVKDAVLASCAAPIYLEPVKVGEYLLADGGLWANNPTLAAIIDARYRLGVALDDIRVLSLGTGASTTAYGTRARAWGFMTGWRGSRFIDFVSSLQARSIHNYVRLMLAQHQLVRINFETDRPLSLDDRSVIEDLISRADTAFTHAMAALANFLKP